MSNQLVQGRGGEGSKGFETQITFYFNEKKFDVVPLGKSFFFLNYKLGSKISSVKFKFNIYN